PRGFAPKWLKDHVAHTADDCLIWPYAKLANGYAAIRIDGKTTTAARIMCVAAHGEPLTPQLEAAHSCGNGHLGCVNPRHLRWATTAENNSDKNIHGTMMKG